MNTLSPAQLAIEVLDMGSLASEDEALALGGEAAAAMFRAQGGGACAGSDGYALRAFNSCSVSCGSEDVGAPATAAVPLHSSVTRALRAPPNRDGSIPA